MSVSTSLPIAMGAMDNGSGLRALQHGLGFKQVLRRVDIEEGIMRQAEPLGRGTAEAPREAINLAFATGQSLSQSFAQGQRP